MLLPSHFAPSDVLEKPKKSGPAFKRKGALMGGAVVTEDPVLHTLEVCVVNLPYELDIQQFAHVVRGEEASRPRVDVIASVIIEVRALANAQSASVTASRLLALARPTPGPLGPPERCSAWP